MEENANVGGSNARRMVQQTVAIGSGDVLMVLFNSSALRALAEVRFAEVRFARESKTAYVGRFLKTILRRRTDQYKNLMTTFVSASIRGRTNHQGERPRSVICENKCIGVSFVPTPFEYASISRTSYSAFGTSCAVIFSRGIIFN